MIDPLEDGISSVELIAHIGDDLMYSLEREGD